MIELSRYVFETLREDEEFAYCRGRRDDSELPTILLVAPVSEHPVPAILEGLEHEYALRDELNSDWAARPLTIVRRNGRPTLILKDPGGEPLDRLLGQPMELSRFLHFAVGLAAALGKLHQQGLIHKDIKPANILVDSASGAVWLTGFGIASRLPRERQSAEAPEMIAGTLAYMAPEQTGRMNRSIDSRSDLYSLGVTFYEMLTGALPFKASDPVEWVHCHIARQPVAPDQYAKEIPAPLSAIVMKLLAKTAEERYQTAAGVAGDLRRCLSEWEAHRRIDPFQLGAHDVSDRLLIPEKLYGREREIDALLASFDRVVANGIPELVLVSGYSGMGKSSLVQELHKVIVLPRGIFISGKFDRTKRNVPYALLAQVFQTLVHQILSESQQEVAHWRATILEALGSNGQLMINLIPELELVIGKQPVVPELPPQETQNRFEAVLRGFIGVFARKEHPLVLFVDDLQWLDPATLKLLEQVATDSSVQHLLLIGAYRDNEVTNLAEEHLLEFDLRALLWGWDMERIRAKGFTDNVVVTSVHPLMLMLGAIRKTEAIVHEISLNPLSLEDVNQLLGDALRCELAHARPLAELVHEKTRGNPFFTIQFLTNLAEEHLLEFDAHAALWRWDVERIRAKGFTDNVVDLMIGKLNRLSDATQEALKQLASLGSGAEIASLALVQGESKEQIHVALWEAVRAGLVLRLHSVYTFLNDRVQEAAYALIPESERAAVHLRIGRLFVSRTPPEHMEQKIFEIVNQLNRGTVLIGSLEERKRVAELNLAAGKRAKTSAAYASALTYFVAGRALLTEESWEQQHALTFALEFQRAECEFLSGDFAAAEERLSALSRRAGDLADSAAVARLQTELYTALDQCERAVEAGLEYLRRVGVDWSLHPTNDQVRQEYDRIWQQLGNRPIEALVDLPPMTNPACRATLDVLAVVEGPAFFTDQNLRDLVVARMINLSLRHGNSDGSCLAYAQLGWIVGPRFGDYQAAFRFGKLGLDLVEKHGLERFRTRVSQIFGYFINPWSRPLRSSVGLLRRSFTTAQEAGDVIYSVYACDRLVTFLLAAGAQLGDVQREAENGLEFAQTTKFAYVVDIIIGQLRFIRTLRGLTPSFSSFNDAEFDEAGFEQHLEADPHLVFATCWYWIRKLQARFYAGDYMSALAAASKAEPLLQRGPGHFEWAEYIFYSALVGAAKYDSASSEEKVRYRKALATHHKQIVVWAENCPENFGNRAALVAAEIARIEGCELDAERLYEKAIQSAREYGFVQNEAIAHEAAARFYGARGFETIAHAYLRNARYCYLRWGALGKVEQLDQRYPAIAEQTSSRQTVRIAEPVKQLDLETVTKASQAVSSEIVLEKLIETLMRIAIEHAGAERGLLILQRGEEHRIEAEARTGCEGAEVQLRQAAATPAELPESLLRYVIRTQQSVILEDASSQSLFSEDPYLLQERPRSVLCLPLVKQTKLIGALYLENNLASRVFTPKRLAMLELLASQAAISLDHARLYADLGRLNAELTQENNDRRNAEEALRASEERWRKLFETSSAGIALGTPDGCFRAANLALQKMLGYTEEELQGLTPLELTLEEDRAGTKAPLAGLAEGQRRDFEKRFRCKDGNVIWADISSAVVPATGSTPAFFASVVVDITERKRAEEALQKAQTELAHISRVTTMGELAASIAHEVNQPLGAIANNVNTCLRLLPTGSENLQEVEGALSDIVRGVDRVNSIIVRMRALAKKVPPEMARLHIEEVVTDVSTLIHHELTRRHVAIHTELSKDLPAILGDRVQLQQVLLNLVMNGVEAMNEVAEGERKIAIRARRHQHNGRAAVLVSVQDSGVGLKAAEVDRLFEAFYTTKAHGIGMGLAISRSIVEAHGGRLWVAPAGGPGATFEFILPAKS